MLVSGKMAITPLWKELGEELEQLYRTRQHFVCSAKTATAV